MHFPKLISILVTTTTSLASSSPTTSSTASPNNLITLSPRQGGLGKVLGALFDIAVSGINAAAAKDLQAVFGSPTPTCCDNSVGNCLINAGTDSAGNKWMACYYGGDEEIYAFDVAAMDCIINLHYMQEDACIDIKGSVCGNNYGGGLMRGQMGWWGGNQRADRISAQDSATFQAAANSMLGVKINYTEGDNAAIDLNVVSNVNGLLDNEMMFDGHMGRDC